MSKTLNYTHLKFLADNFAKNKSCAVNKLGLNNDNIIILNNTFLI